MRASPVARALPGEAWRAARRRTYGTAQLRFRRNAAAPGRPCGARSRGRRERPTSRRSAVALYGAETALVAVPTLGWGYFLSMADRRNV
jgi:hypothetical protein